MNNINNDDGKQVKKQVQRNPVQRSTEQTALERTVANHISDMILNAIRNIGLFLAKLIDRVFGTSISKNPGLNKKIITGKRVKLEQAQGQNHARSKQAGKSKRQGQIKISKSEPIQEEQEQKDQSLIQIKDVLNGKASDGALRKQQERQAEAGHRFFSQAIKTEQNNTMSHAR